jgi:hypothetical protein
VLRVRVELIPGGNVDDVEILDEVYITNDGTGERPPAGSFNAANEGGIGNYDVHRAVGRSGVVGHLGRIENVLRTKSHRLELAIKALQILRNPGPRRAGL